MSLTIEELRRYYATPRRHPVTQAMIDAISVNVGQGDLLIAYTYQHQEAADAWAAYYLETYGHEDVLGFPENGKWVSVLKLDVDGYNQQKAGG